MPSPPASKHCRKCDVNVLAPVCLFDATQCQQNANCGHLCGNQVGQLRASHWKHNVAPPYQIQFEEDHAPLGRLQVARQTTLVAIDHHVARQHLE